MSPLYKEDVIVSLDFLFSRAFLLIYTLGVKFSEDSVEAANYRGQFCLFCLQKDIAAVAKKVLLVTANCYRNGQRWFTGTASESYGRKQYKFETT